MPTTLSPEQQAVRAELEAAVVAETGAAGTMDKHALVRRFADRSIGRSTLHRWIDQVLRSGKPVRHIIRKA